MSDLSISSCVYRPSVCLFWRNICLDLWLTFFFFNWIICFSGIELCEMLIHFVNSCLSVVSFSIVFSHFEGCPFTLLIVSFALQKLLRWIRSHLFISVFISIALGRGS